MQDGETITLTRDCEAVLIPAGIKTTLPVGSRVVLTQSLGGSYTVSFGGGLARIDGKDADAIGKAAESPPQPPTQAAGGPLDEKLIWDQMRTCFDPEIPVNIVDLGLVYDCKVIPLPDHRNRVEVKMTLTAPGCGMGVFIASDVEQKIRALPGVADVKVDLVWDPVWNQGMMTEAARLQLGLM